MDNLESHPSRRWLVSAPCQIGRIGWMFSSCRTSEQNPFWRSMQTNPGDDNYNCQSKCSVVEKLLNKYRVDGSCKQIQNMLSMTTIRLFTRVSGYSLGFLSLGECSVAGELLNKTRIDSRRPKAESGFTLMNATQCNCFDSGEAMLRNPPNSGSTEKLQNQRKTPVHVL